MHFDWLTSKKIPKLKVCSFTIKLGDHSSYVTGLEKMEAGTRWTPRMVWYLLSFSRPSEGDAEDGKIKVTHGKDKVTLCLWAALSFLTWD